MIVLSDNDILLKLAYCDLLPYLPSYLDVVPRQIFILPSCIFKLRSLLKNDPVVLNRLEIFCGQLSLIVDDDVDLAMIDILSNTGADDGEVILAAKVTTTPGSYLLTGDKRAIKAFTNLPDGEIRSALAGRIICFDELILGMFRKYGFEQLQPNFSQGRGCDKMLGMAFGPGRDHEHAVACLSSSARELRETCSWLLVEA